jgi:hypothetical protein
MIKKTAGDRSSLILLLRRWITRTVLLFGIELLSWSDDLIWINLLLIIIEEHLLLNQIVSIFIHVLNHILSCLPDYVLIANVDFVLVPATSSC